jgi:uncharacterized membrane protein
VKKYFITGLLVWIPLVITVWVITALINWMDQLLPVGLRPEDFVGTRIPGLGILIVLVLLFVTGVLVSNIVGQKLLRIWEGVLTRIPVVNSLYGGVKQVSDTLLSPSGQAFRKALLVQWPHPGMWTIAFQTGTPGGDVVDHLAGEHVSVYVPTTPNPTGGYFVMVPRAHVVELQMTVDEALKYVISMGVVAPPRRTPRRADALSAPPL